MEKLTLEHIAPYLPYGLMATTKEQKYKNAGIGTISQWDGKGNSDEQIIIYPGHGYYLSSIENTIPILRPMSQLTETIIVDGKEVVPIVELAKIATNVPDIDTANKITYNFDLKQLEVIGKKGYKLIFTFDESDSSFVMMHKGVSYTITNQLHLFQWLFKHKFDVFNLIPAGLAIDVNTLTENPYK